MKKLNLETFEIIVAITRTYEYIITDFLEEENGEVDEIKFASLVMDMYQAYTQKYTEITHNELLEKIYDDTISINNVI